MRNSRIILFLILSASIHIPFGQTFIFISSVSARTATDSTVKSYQKISDMESSVTTMLDNSDVFTLKVDSMAGSHIQLEYDESKLGLTSVSIGDLFQSSKELIFFSDDDAMSGIVDIYTSFLGTTTSVSGTGNLVHLVFRSTAPGTTLLKYIQACELMDPDESSIEIGSFDESLVVVK